MKHVVDAPKPHDIDDTCNKVFGNCSKCPYVGYMQIKVLDKLGLLRRETDSPEDYRQRVFNWFYIYTVMTAIGLIIADGTLFELISRLK